MQWVIDELHQHGVAPPATLLVALMLFAGDPSVRLPGPELAAYNRRYEALSRKRR